MNKLTEQERNELIRLLQASEPIPVQWRGKLFPGGMQNVEIGKEYRLEYAGKMKREQVLAETPAAPWQLVRRFAEDRTHGDGWRNLLVWGDKTGKTHAVNEFFNPDYFIRLKDSHDVLVVEIKHDGDDSSRNKAKYRDGKAHFERLNEALEKENEPWRYYFYFLSPEDYSGFFDRVKDGRIKGWKSVLMVELGK